MYSLPLIKSKVSSPCMDILGVERCSWHRKDIYIFGSDRSPRNADVRSSVSNLSRAVNLHLSGSNLQAIWKESVSQQSVSSQRALRRQSVSTQSIKIRVNTVGAFKYCVLLAPTGAQGVTICLRPFVCPVQSCLEQSIFILLAQIFKQSVRNKSAVNEHSKSTQKAHREQSKSNLKPIREQSESNQWAFRASK